MRLIHFCLLLLSLVAFVAGQLLLKIGMRPAADGRLAWRRSAVWLGAGVTALAIYFFLTLGLLQQYDLSYLFPFQGVTVVLIAGAASVILKEKLTWQMTIGSLLITAGVVLVSLS